MIYSDIKTERQFKATTGYSRAIFGALCEDFKDTFYEQYGQTYQEYVAENVTEPPIFKSLEQSLFFVLFQMKNDLIWGSLGAVFRMGETTARDNYVKYNHLLELTLEKKSNAQA